MANGTDQTFSDIIRGMQYAVNTAQDTLQNQQFNQMRQYFQDDGTPHIMYINLSDGRRIYIPQITLVPQSLLAIDELEMSFSVQVAHTEVKDGLEPEKGEQQNNGKTAKGPDRSSFQVQFTRRALAEEEGRQAPDMGTISVKIKFKSIPLPEGAARVLDALNLDIVESQQPETA
jgi:hypothetical protein